MPSDTYILTISEAGVSIPSTHASTHLTGGSDAIPVASTSTSGLMSPTIFDQHVVNNAKISNKTHTGDVTDASGVLTVSKINGVALAPLGTGILRMSSGTPSLATDGTQFPTLNQNTTGNAATATTATNIVGGSVGSIPYQTGSGATTMLSAGASGYVLKSNGSAAPSWGAVELSSGTSGTLPVSAGGTGVTTLAAGIVKSNGTSQFQRVDAPTGDIVGTSDTQVLTNKQMGSGTTFSSAIPVQYGGTGVTTLAAGIVKSNGSSNFSRVDAPTGDIVGTSDTQTLMNKTFVAPALGTPASGTLTNCTGLPLTTGVTGTLLAEKGGTGQSSYAVGDLLYANTTTSVAKLADVAAGSVLLSGGVGIAPSYGKVGLTTHVTGTLPVANGGTGLATVTGYVKGTGTAALSTSSTIPATDISGTLLAEKGGTGYSSFAVGDLLYANTTTSLAKLADVAAGSVLLSGGIAAAPSYGKVDLTTHVTGILPLENGGTGQDLSDEGSGVVIKDGSDIIDIVSVLPKGYGGTGQSASTFGGCYLASPTATTFSLANVWTKVVGTTTFITGEGVDAGTASNQIRSLAYGNNVLISVTGSFSGSNANIIKVGVFLNGGLIVSSPIQVTITGAGHLMNFSCQCYIPLFDYGSYIELFVQNTSSSNSVTFDSFNVFARSLI